MRVLITGASGAIGESLVRALAGRHELRGLAREPSRVSGALELVRGDALSGEGLERALEGIDTAYYLIHSMEPAVADSFEARDRAAAERFAAAAAQAGVKRIVYLGGLHSGDGPSSAHLESRGEVEQILLAAVPDSVALRASLVIGARSRSFRAIVRLVERLPVIPLPPWRRHRTQPIDERDAIAYLVAAAETADVGGRSYDIAGAELLSYGEMIVRIASLLLLERPIVRLPLDPRALASAFAARASGESHELLGPLMGSLRGDLIADDTAARAAFEIPPLHGFDAAVEHALREWEASEPLGAR
ncbi:MAG TPA: NAD(P)H-binding protein [Solirubrobacteraceae bacterium]|nr:NAD(P)H-binding protein [Solirubrobacteraceae bacterium]